MDPRTAATFRVLETFQMLSFTSKISAFEYYCSLARRTDNTGVSVPPDHYHAFLRAIRKWRHVWLLKRMGCGHSDTGVTGTAEGELAVACPACPIPDVNLPADWKSCPEKDQWLDLLFLSIDANFRLKRLNVSNDQCDPGLNHGYAYVVENTKFKKYLDEFNSKIPDDKSTCNNHDAIKSATMSTWTTSSYPWGRNLRSRCDVYPPNALSSHDITFLVPKFHLPAHISQCQIDYSFNLVPGVGRTDGEAAEHGWSAANAVTASTKEMGPGSHHDTLDDHFVLRAQQDRQGGGTPPAVQDLELFLPSHIVGTVACDKRFLRYKFDLRIFQADATLDEIRSSLLLRSHMYKLKDRLVRGQRQNTRSNVLLGRVEDRVKVASDRYNKIQRALTALLALLLEFDWSQKFRVLEPADVTGLTSLDDDGSEEPMPHSVSNGVKRARAHRWQEECLLLQEEMRHVITYFSWQAKKWRRQAEGHADKVLTSSRTDARLVAADAAAASIVREGKVAYVYQQAAIRDSIKNHCIKM
ncbi:hypothetical protein BDZ97DRAFT_1923452 [Flammula alnicola]|nr:hypothetical protein BDZ97DRAFT_1923452 [Flammula alnicola]